MKNILHKLEEHSTLVAILIGVFGCFLFVLMVPFLLLNKLFHKEE